MLKSLITAAAVAMTLGLGASGALAAGDAANGEKMANRFCKACHTFKEGDKHMVGPNLWGIAGQEPGMVEGYSRYQAAPLFVANGVAAWTDEALTEYLTDPSAFREQYGEGKPSAMILAPLKPEMVADIVAYLGALK